MISAAPARGEDQQRGFAMAALLVTLAIMGVAMGVAVPVWHNVVQRDREEELIFRGRQYARAIGLFQRRFANTYPPSFDVLVEQKFLRKKYADPMTESGEFVVLYQGSAFSLPGGGAASPGAGRQSGGSSSPFGAGISASTIGSRTGQSSAFGTAGRGTAGPRGGVIGVVSASEAKSIKILDGRSQYSEWRFVWLPTTTPGRGGGANQPGGRGGRGDPGGLGPGLGRGQGRGLGRGSGGGRGEGRGGLGSPGQGRGGQPGLPGGGRQSGRGHSA